MERLTLNTQRVKELLFATGYSTEAVAEFAFAAILENIRELERGKKLSGEGNYSEAGFSATEIRGKTFGILGLEPM